MHKCAKIWPINASPEKFNYMPIYANKFIVNTFKSIPQNYKAMKN